MAWVTTKDGRHVNTEWFDEKGNYKPLTKEEHEITLKYIRSTDWVHEQVNRDLESGKDWDQVMRQVYESAKRNGFGKDNKDKQIEANKKEADKKNAEERQKDADKKSWDKEKQRAMEDWEKKKLLLEDKKSPKLKEGEKVLAHTNNPKYKDSYIEAKVGKSSISDNGKRVYEVTYISKKGNETGKAWLDITEIKKK